MSKVRKMSLKDFCNIFDIAYIITREAGENALWIAQIEGLRVIDKTKGPKSLSISGSDKQNNNAISALKNLVDKLNLEKYVFCEINGSPIKLPLLNLN